MPTEPLHIQGAACPPSQIGDVVSPALLCPPGSSYWPTCVRDNSTSWEADTSLFSWARIQLVWGPRFHLGHTECRKALDIYEVHNKLNNGPWALFTNMWNTFTPWSDGLALHGCKIRRVLWTELCRGCVEMNKRKNRQYTETTDR